MKIYHTGTEELWKFDRVGGRVTIFFFFRVPTHIMKHVKHIFYRKVTVLSGQ